MLINLSDGRITVEHGTDNVELLAWNAREGDWDQIWDQMRRLKANEIAK